MQWDYLQLAEHRPLARPTPVFTSSGARLSAAAPKARACRSWRPAHGLARCPPCLLILCAHAPGVEATAVTSFTVIVTTITVTTVTAPSLPPLSLPPQRLRTPNTAITLRQRLCASLALGPHLALHTVLRNTSLMQMQLVSRGADSDSLPRYTH